MHRYKFKIGQRITDKTKRGMRLGIICGIGYDFDSGRKRYGYFIEAAAGKDWIYESEARLV